MNEAQQKIYGPIIFVQQLKINFYQFFLMIIRFKKTHSGSNSIMVNLLRKKNYRKFGLIRQ